MRELRRGLPATSSIARSLGERQARPLELGPKRQQKREKCHHEDGDLYHQEERLHDHCSTRTGEWFDFFLASRGLGAICVDPAFGLLQLAAGAAGADGEDLGQDRERRLGRRVGADVESRGSGDALQLLL